MVGITRWIDLWIKNPSLNGQTLRSMRSGIAEIALLIDQLDQLDLRKYHHPSLNAQILHSTSLHSRAASAVASLPDCTPYVDQGLFRFDGRRFAPHCDAIAPPLTEDYLTSLRTASATISQHVYLEHVYLDYEPKEYYIVLKPLLSAFQLKSLALTSLRSFLLFYLPLLRPRAQDKHDEKQKSSKKDDSPDEQHVDLVTPFKKATKHIVRQTCVETTRRFLERLAIQYFSQRTAWKLLKDVSKSAARKADRGLPILTYFFTVGRTTFRGCFLGAAASWLVQVCFEMYGFFSALFRSDNKEDDDNYKVDETARQVKILGKKIYCTTVRRGASMVFASIGAGIGATLFHPSSGQSIGCLIGELVSFLFEEFLNWDLFWLS